MSVCGCKHDGRAALHHLSGTVMAPLGALQVPALAGADTPLSGTGIDVVLVRLEATIDSVRASQAILSTDESKRARRILSERARNQFVVARARLRKLLGDRLGVTAESVELRNGRFGKPVLAPDSSRPNLRFNFSRCGNVAAYAFSLDREIGIDIERVRAIRNADGIAARFFSRREYESYRALDARTRLLGFFNCWTRKEAFVKAVGNGLSHPLGGFDVSLAPGAPAQLERVGNVAGDQCGWQLADIACFPGFVSAIAIQRPRRGDDAT